MLEVKFHDIPRKCCNFFSRHVHSHLKCGRCYIDDCIYKRLLEFIYAFKGCSYSHTLRVLFCGVLRLMNDVTMLPRRLDGVVGLFFFIRLFMKEAGWGLITCTVVANGKEKESVKMMSSYKYDLVMSRWEGRLVFLHQTV